MWTCYRRLSDHASAMHCINTVSCHARQCKDAEETIAAQSMFVERLETERKDAAARKAAEASAEAGSGGGYNLGSWLPPSESESESDYGSDADDSGGDEEAAHGAVTAAAAQDGDVIEGGGAEEVPPSAAVATAASAAGAETGSAESIFAQEGQAIFAAATGGAQAAVYECEGDCGFAGSFEEVEAHEATCAIAIAAAAVED